MATVLLLLFMASLHWFPAQPTIEPPLKASAAPANTVLVAAQDTAAQAAGSKKKRSRKAKDTNKSRVTMTRNVPRATLTKNRNDRSNAVEIVVMRLGMTIRNVEDLQLTGNSGNTTSTGSYMGFDNINFPVVVNNV